MMQLIVIISILLVVVSVLLVGSYMIYRRGLRYAKGIERGIKMVPILINLPPASEDAEVGARDIREVIQERASQAEVLYNLIASTATKGFKSKFFGQRHIGFEIVAIEGIIRFYAAVPVALVAVIEQAILTAYPGASLEEVEDHNIFSETGKITGTYGGEMKLKHDYAYPIATSDQLKSDAVQGILNSLTSLEQGDGAGIQILLRPAHDGWSKSSESLAKSKREDDKSGISFKSVLQAPFKVPEGGDKDEGPKPPKQLSNIEQSAVDAIEEKTKSAGYEVLIRIVSSSGTASRAQAITNNIVSSFSLFDAPGLNGFKFEPAKNMEQFVTDFIFRFFPPERRQTILNSVELSTLFHFPDDQFTKTTQVERQFSKQVEGPSRLSSEGMLIGHNVYRGTQKPIRISEDDRRRHVYVVGQTGTGKTVLLQNMMVQDMQEGRGFAFIDPHGDAAEELLGMLPPERSEDVIYFDPGDMDNPPGLNIFEYHTEDQKDFLIQEAINMLYRLYDPQQQGIIGPRYEHLFRNAALTVMADPEGGTFIDIPKLFRDPQFVREKLKHVEDKTVLEFWQKEMPQSQRSNDFGEIVSWFVSKFGAFLSNQMMRNIIGQPKSSFDLRDVMDSNKILIANLSKGRLGELNSMLLGMIFVMKFQAAAMSRANVPENQRKDFSLYVDEFQNFSTESFAFILSEARKYRMNLIVANQFISQLSDEVREAVFGNIGTIISFRTGPNDADYLVKQFSPVFNDRDLVNMPNFNAAIRLMSKGLPTQPFNLSTLPPLGESNPQLAAALKKLSAAKYGHSRKEVETRIFDRLSTKPAPSPFESLASSQGQEASGQANAATSGSSAQGSKKSSTDSSFLDEWLAKRRQSMQGGGSAQSGRTQSTQPNRQQPSGQNEQSFQVRQRGVSASQPAANKGTINNNKEYSMPQDQSNQQNNQAAQGGKPNNNPNSPKQTNGSNDEQENNPADQESLQTPNSQSPQQGQTQSQYPQPQQPMQNQPDQNTNNQNPSVQSAQQPSGGNTQPSTPQNTPAQTQGNSSAEMPEQGVTRDPNVSPRQTDQAANGSEAASNHSENAPETINYQPQSQPTTQPPVSNPASDSRNDNEPTATPQQQQAASNSAPQSSPGNSSTYNKQQSADEGQASVQPNNEGNENEGVREPHQEKTIQPPPEAGKSKIDSDSLVADLDEKDDSDYEQILKNAEAGKTQAATTENSQQQVGAAGDESTPEENQQPQPQPSDNPDQSKMSKAELEHQPTASSAASNNEARDPGAAESAEGRAADSGVGQTSDQEVQPQAPANDSQSVAEASTGNIQQDSENQTAPVDDSADGEVDPGETVEPEASSEADPEQANQPAPTGQTESATQQAPVTSETAQGVTDDKEDATRGETRTDDQQNQQTEATDNANVTQPTDSEGSAEEAQDDLNVDFSDGGQGTPQDKQSKDTTGAEAPSKSGTTDQPPEPKPGEIYIDEEGNVHKGE